MNLDLSSKLEGALSPLRLTQQPGRSQPPHLGTELSLHPGGRSVAAFAWKQERPGNPQVTYLSLCVELARDVKYFGFILANVDNTEEPSSPDYVGALHLTTERGGPALRITGRRWPNQPAFSGMDVVIEGSITLDELEHLRQGHLPAIQERQASAA